PFTALHAVSRAIGGTRIALGAQNLHWEKAGAFTGEIAAAQLLDSGCAHVIIGHSERRQFFGETDDTVSRRLGAALAAGLTPIVCVGETLDQRKTGRTEAVIREQVQKGLAGLDAQALGRLVIAYEPVWAIGTGMTATPDQAQDTHAFIRGLLKSMAGEAVAGAVRIQYGGSVKPANAKELFGRPDIDGGLIGGASLDAASFVAIVKAAV
ncbi:MAG: triose-phosphate isomerase, partial [Lentisphaerae bacterium]|nr:triose-phosphate isomerase [Lentisphaerota bacterium]